MEILKQYRPFFVFLLKFFGIYALLGLLYHFYLQQFGTNCFEVDDATILVAQQSKWFVMQLGYSCDLLFHQSQAAVKFILNGTYVARVVEGCNGISVLILFASFIVAFTGKWKTMLLFILCGSLLIHVLNIVRIGLLSMALLHYPHYEHILHGVLFPAVIYGTVFLLWVVWVNKFSGYARHDKN